MCGTYAFKSLILLVYIHNKIAMDANINKIHKS